MWMCTARAHTSGWYHRTAKSLRIAYTYTDAHKKLICFMLNKQWTSLFNMVWSFSGEVILFRWFACACTSTLIAYLLLFKPSLFSCFLSAWICIAKTFFVHFVRFGIEHVCTKAKNPAHCIRKWSAKWVRSNFARYPIFFQMYNYNLVILGSSNDIIMGHTGFFVCK